MESIDIVAEAVFEYWKAHYPQDVVVFFRQKYVGEDKWERREELAECHGSDDYENLTFLSDFCEGQTEVEDLVIIPFCEVADYYYKSIIKNREEEA